MKKSVPDMDMLRSALADARLAIVECDKLAWAFLRRIEYPLASYDLETWEALRREGEPDASLASNPTACMEALTHRWPESSMKIRAEKGSALIEVCIAGLGMRVQGEYRGKLALENIGRGLAIAVLAADTNAKTLQQRLFRVSGLAEVVAPYAEWPVEMIDGRFHAVDHKNRLACAGGFTQELARDFSTMNHKGDYGLMLCRERYEKLFGAPEMETTNTPDADIPEPGQ